MDKKVIKIIIAIMVILAIIITGLIIVLLNTNEPSEEYINNNSTLSDGHEYVQTFITIQKVSSRDMFLSINDNIQKYIDYLRKNKIEEAKTISESQLFTNLGKNKTYFWATEMYQVDIYKSSVFFVKGETSLNDEEKYLCIQVDYKNNTYRMIEITEQQFKTAQTQEWDLESQQEISIEDKTFNKYEFSVYNDYNLVTSYFDRYKLYIKNNNLQKAYEYLDNEYKRQKFNNDYTKFTSYINGINIIGVNITAYASETKDGYTQYLLKGDNDNIYIMRSTSMGQFTILLDNYTIESQEFIKQYSLLSDEEKVATNVDKIFKCLNNKEYLVVYNYLADSFKNNYFKTYEEFEKYAKNTFFDYNYVGALSISEEQSYYVIEIPYKETVSAAAESRKIKIIMQLGEETDFVMSFGME